MLAGFIRKITELNWIIKNISFLTINLTNVYEIFK